jgi:hypothetical protein
MPAFETLLLPAAKAFMLAQLTVCPLPAHAPRVNIYFLPEKPTYITQAPMKALTEAMQGNPDSTFASDSRWIAFGITEGKIIPGFSVMFDTVSDSAGNTCLTVGEVKIALRYVPTIFIAKEIGPFECQFRMVRLHEERHVATDLTTIKEYIPKLKMETLWYLRSLGPQGPYPAEVAKKQVRTLSDQIIKSGEPVVQKLVQVRRDRQGLIDTAENYHQEAELCPGDLLQLKDIK